MDWTIIIFLTPLMLIFTICGIQLLRGKWLMLIAGYNTAPKKSREQMNGPALGKLLGSLLIICSVLMLILGLFPKPTIIFLIINVICLLSFGSLIYANTSEKFTNKL
ncbi:DUF3784 domain-containing protein [Vagococcus sp. BWB3-3]|uniref:DUF3784 domain-containing protein n=1 Tax=Vagococcus allomyrinae TaxID=2794353 RepID=A0A940PIV3_9ENTE|nr:DUF3784 domain-containing protein [Vagococcus allomyrinae]MBP1044391.1 DUF3784 domain-containing protein [Vagococcus allomyrinae]